MYSGVIQSMLISPDNQTLFVIIGNTLSTVLNIYDISNLTDVNLLSSTMLRGSFLSIVSGMYLIEPNILLVISEPCLLAVDISSKPHPRLVGFISLPETPDVQTLYMLAYMTKSQRFPLLYTDGINQMTLLNFKPPYMIDIPYPVIQLGQIYENKIRILQRNPIDRYTLIQSNYQILSFSFYNVTSQYNTMKTIYSSLPSWITLDAYNGILRLLPGSQVAYGTYYLYCQIVTPLTAQDFDGISNIDIDDLLLNLISFGYIDNNYYLTANFNPDEKLSLPTNYNISA